MFARWSKTIVACALTVLSAIAASAAPSDDEFILRSSVEEVRLTLIATDRQHHYVNDLVPSELAIVDNEVIVRKFRSFTHSSEGRLNVLFVIDASNSVSDRRKRDTTNVLDSIRNAAWDSADTVSAFTFGDGKPQLDCIKNCGSLNLAADPPPAGGKGVTALYDNLIYGVGLLSRTRTPDAKSILIVFSDGDDNYSIRSLADAVDTLQRIDAIAYSVDLNGNHSIGGQNNLEQLARATGGVRLSIDQGPAPILQTVLNDLRSAYVLTYVPPVQSQGLHAVQVLPTHNLDLRFRSRHGYIYNRISEEARTSR